MKKQIYEDILYEYQKQAVDASESHKNFYLALEPGLGKTLTSLAIAQKNKISKIIVVCQKSKVVDWADEIERTLGLKTCVLRGIKARDEKALREYKDGAIIGSYQTIWRRDNLLNGQDVMLIVDESQYLKSHRANVTKWGIKYSYKCGKVILLSGTPINKPEDFYSQMKMLGMDMNYKEFSDTFFIVKSIKFPGSRWPANIITGYKNLDLLYKAFGSQSFSMKTEEAIDLPKQNFIDLKLNNEKINIYKKVKKNKIYKDLEIPSSATLFLRLRQLSSGFIENYQRVSEHKVEALKEFLESNENNIVIFYNFIRELEDIKSICKELNIKVFECNGETKNHDLAKECKGRYVILAQYLSAAEGHNWQFCNNILYYSPPVSFMKYKQSLARIHRIGQTKPVFYYHFITNESIEMKIYDNLKKGKDYDEKIFASDLENEN